MSRCIGSQFEVIENAKQALLDSTNIITSPKEMACLNDILFRCWQMGWLDKYDGNKDVVEVVRCKDCKYNDRGWCGSQEYGTRHVEDNDFCSQGEERRKK